MVRIETYLCRKCEYDLAGLGTRGRCPECGNYFDIARREGIKRLDDPTTSNVRLWAHIRTLLLAGLGATILACGGLLYVATGSRRIGFTLAFIAGVVFLGALTSYLQDKFDPDMDD